MSLSCLRVAGNGFRAGAVFTWRLQKLFNKDNDFNIDVKVLRLAFKDRLQPTICPRDAREGAKEKLSPLPCVRRWLLFL